MKYKASKSKAPKTSSKSTKPKRTTIDIEKFCKGDTLIDKTMTRMKY